MDGVERHKAEIAAEALRQAESCLYTSTQLYMWLRCVRFWAGVIKVAPIVLTAVAGAAFLQELMPLWMAAGMAFLSTLIPSVAEAVDIQTKVGELKSAAAEYKVLQDRFRQLAKLGTLAEVDRAQDRLDELMDRMDVVRANSITPPESYYKKAREKIKAGDYDFTVDIELRQAAASGLVKPMDKPE